MSGCYLKNKMVKLWSFVRILRSIVHPSEMSVKSGCFIDILHIVPRILYSILVQNLCNPIESV